jgi:hypothetical protein
LEGRLEANFAGEGENGFLKGGEWQEQIHGLRGLTEKSEFIPRSDDPGTVYREWEVHGFGGGPRATARK